MQQQESPYDRYNEESTTPPQSNQTYTTHINELISQPATANMYEIAAEYIYSSLYQLSTYLFKKKLGHLQQNAQGEARSELDFHDYLDSMGEELGRFGRLKAIKQNIISKQTINIESELIKCYQKVQSIYFQEKYFLDFSCFHNIYSQLKNHHPEERRKVNQQIEILNDELDLVQINLFSQIHCKFQEYFAAAANFEYLQQSVNQQLRKLKESRSRIKRVKCQLVDQSVKLRQKIVQRQNIEKTLKTIKTMRSIKKLPQVMESILASSLPFDCLQLLQQTKASQQSVKQLKCLSHTSQLIKSMEALAQNDLTKRYSNELYLYLQECHIKEKIHLEDIWKKLEIRTCLDKDNSLIIDQLNSSSSSIVSQSSVFLENLQQVGSQGKGGNSKGMIPRLQERQYQIAMILLQSYQYINFTPEVIKIKVCNALRRFSKVFEKELLVYLNKVVRLQIQNRKENERILDEVEKPKGKEKDIVPPVLPKKQSEEEQVSTQVVQKVTVQFYSKHLAVLNDIFRQTIIRLLGYLQTLISEYQEQLIQKNDGRIAQRHKKFKLIFIQECSMLPSIFKIIEQKIKYLLTLKNIRNINSVQFYQWISILKYWQRFFDYLIDQHSLINFTPKSNPTTQPLITELAEVVGQNLRRAIATMNLKSLLLDLTVDYLNVFHNNTLQNQIINTLQEDTWQSTEVPQEFSQILNNILNPEGTVLNASITILDSSSASSKMNASRQSNKDLSKGEIKDEGRVRIKFKLLKNNILVGGVRYKVNLSLIVLCETIAEYVKMNRILSNILPREYVEEVGHNKISKYIYEKIFDLIYKFCMKSKELILQTKALQYGKIKAKNINAKHICLLCNCYSVLIKISDEILEKNKIETYGLTNNQMNTIAFLENTHGQLTNKLSIILNSKIQKQVNDYIAQQKNPGCNVAALSNKTNNTIITSFLQMVQITDQYLEIEDIRKVLRSAFQSLTQKYFTHLLLKGDKFRGEVEGLGEKLKFLKKYFVLEYEALLKQIPN